MARAVRAKSETARKPSDSRVPLQNARDFDCGKLVALLRAALKDASRAAASHAKALDYALRRSPLLISRNKKNGENFTAHSPLGENPSKAYKRRARRARAHATARDRSAEAAVRAGTGNHRDESPSAPPSANGARPTASGEGIEDTEMAAEPTAAPTSSNPLASWPMFATAKAPPSYKLAAMKQTPRAIVKKQAPSIKRETAATFVFGRMGGAAPYKKRTETDSEEDQDSWDDD
jgi:hypothetical protein